MEEGDAWAKNRVELECIGQLPQCICDKWLAWMARWLDGSMAGRPLKANDNNDEVKDLRSEIAHFGSEPGPAGVWAQFFVCYLG